MALSSGILAASKSTRIVKQFIGGSRMEMLFHEEQNSQNYQNIPILNKVINFNINKTLNKNNYNLSSAILQNLSHKSISYVPIRNFHKKFLNSNELSSIESLPEMKLFLKRNYIDFEDGFSALKISLPKFILSNNPHVYPSSNWKDVDESIDYGFINKTTGRFISPKLAVTCNWKTFKEIIIVWNKNKTIKKGDPLLKYPTLSYLDLNTPKIVTKKLSKSVPIQSFKAADFKKLLKYFKIPIKDFKLDHFVNFEAHVTEDKKELLFPIRYPGNSNIIDLRIYSLCPESGEAKETNLVKPFNEDNIFPFPHGLDRAYKINAKEIVILSSIIDAIVISKNLVASKNDNDVCAVTLPGGSSTLHPDHLSYLERFPLVSIWFNNDSLSCESAKLFAKKIGDKRCRISDRDVPSPLLCSKNRDISILEVFRKKMRICSHKYITTFESLREDVFLELAHIQEIEGVKWKRFEGLNQNLKGFRRGELTVFTGKTGTGKTTFISEYSLDLCMEGVTTLWGSFEVKNVRLAKMQLKQFSPINLEKNLDQFDLWADKFQAIPMYYLTFFGSQDADKVLDAMGHAVYIYDISHVIIDNMQFMMGMSGKTILDRFYSQDLIIQKFRKFATVHNVHVTLVIHPRKEDDEHLSVNSIFGGAKATQEADNIVLLQEDIISAKLKRKFVQIAKNRFSGELGIVPLFFNRSTLTFSKKIFMDERNKNKCSETKSEKDDKVNVQNPNKLKDKDYDDDDDEDDLVNPDFEEDEDNDDEL